jgi:hypothetical protein
MPEAPSGVRNSQGGAGRSRVILGSAASGSKDVQYCIANTFRHRVFACGCIDPEASHLPNTVRGSP